MDALDTEPQITRSFLVAILKDAFPGAKIKVVDRIGGIVVSIIVWQFTFEASLTTKQVGHVDEVGIVGLQLVQTTKVMGGKTLPVQVIRTRTNSPATVQAFVGRAKAYLQGAAAALLAVCDRPEEREQESPFGDFEDFDEDLS